MKYLGILSLLFGVQLQFAVSFVPHAPTIPPSLAFPSKTRLGARKGRLSKELADIQASGSESQKTKRVAAPSGSSRREKSENRKSMSSAERKVEAGLVEKIMGLVGEKKRDLPSIQSAVDELRQLNSAQSLRTIVNGNTKDYQLSFAWDDAAVSYVGTGLHKVPLARLDYFFLTLGKGSLLMREVRRAVAGGGKEMFVRITFMVCHCFALLPSADSSPLCRSSASSAPFPPFSILSWGKLALKRVPVARRASSSIL
jgi:hypothetical protein